MSHDLQDSYFEQFGLPAHLHLDLAALEKSFYAQSRRLHPDRFAARPAEEQQAALAASSRLNDAYRTLRDPIARTEYLLALEGVQLEEQSRAATDAAKATSKLSSRSLPGAPPDSSEDRTPIHAPPAAFPIATPAPAAAFRFAGASRSEMDHAPRSFPHRRQPVLRWGRRSCGIPGDHTRRQHPHQCQLHRLGRTDPQQR